MQIKDIINLNFTDNEKFYHVLYLLKLMLDTLISDSNTSIDTLFDDSSDSVKADSKKTFIPVTNSILANIATGLYSLCYNGLPSNYTNNDQTNANVFNEMINNCIDLDSKLSTNTSLNPKNILNYFVVYSHCIQGFNTQVLEYWNDIIVKSIPESFYATLGSKISNTSIKPDIPVIDIQTESFELKDMEQYKEFLEKQKALQAKNGITIPSAIFNIRANNVTLLSPTQVNDHINPTTVDKYNNIIQHEVVEIPKDIIQITKTIVQDNINPNVNPNVKPDIQTDIQTNVQTPDTDIKQIPEIENNQDSVNLSRDYQPQSPSISEDIPENQHKFSIQYTEPVIDNAQTMSTLSENSESIQDENLRYESVQPLVSDTGSNTVSISDDNPVETSFNSEINVDTSNETSPDVLPQDQASFEFNSEPASEVEQSPENNFDTQSQNNTNFEFNSEPASEIDQTHEINVNNNLTQDKARFETSTRDLTPDSNPVSNSNLSLSQDTNFEFNSEPNSEIDQTQSIENKVNTRSLRRETENPNFEFNSEPASEIDQRPENSFNQQTQVQSNVTQNNTVSNPENNQVEPNNQSKEMKASRMSRMSRTEQTLLQSLNSQFD